MGKANITDVRGLSRLALRGAGQVTDLVEDLHQAVAAPFDLWETPGPGRTGGITGLVYRNIHAWYGLVDTSVDAVLTDLAPLFDEPVSLPEREAMLSTVNGVWGDYLAASENPLAIEMSLRSDGRALTLEADALRAALPQLSTKPVVLVHGLCMNDLQWLRGGHNHGAALAEDLHVTPLYLHYNSGLHISTNGQAFADLLETLLNAWPQPVEELVIIGHSMGGLLARSACHYGLRAGHAWPRRLGSLVFLGTPHHGSHLEQAGAWVDELFTVSRYSIPFRRLNRHRSSGMTDLRYGNLRDEDWEGFDRFAPGPDRRYPVPLPDNVRCYAIGALMRATTPGIIDRILGDGLVPLDSALGLHRNPERCLEFSQAQRRIAYNLGHLDLLSRPEVYAQIKAWL